MESRIERRIVAVVLGAGLVWLMADAFRSPTAATWLASGLIIGLTAGLLTVIEGSEAVDPHQYAMSQKKSYSITLRSVLVTAFLTGLFVLGLLLFAGMVIGMVTAFAGYETFSAAVLADALARVELVLQLPGETLLGFGALTAAAAGTGFWLLYPYVPVADEVRAAPAIFVVVWGYMVAAALLSLDVAVPNPAALVLDAAVMAVWGHFFAVAYVDVETYVP